MKQGHGRSLAQTFIQHRDFLRAYLRKRGTRSEDIDDLLQDAFLRCMPILQSEPHRDHRRLLVTVIRNLHIDLYRRRRWIAPQLPEGYLEGLPEDLEPRRQRMRQARVEQLVTQLDEQPETQAFKLHYGEGRKIHEIARLTQSAPGTVSSQIARFRQWMQRRFCEALDAVDECLA